MPEETPETLAANAERDSRHRIAQAKKDAAEAEDVARKALAETEKILKAKKEAESALVAKKEADSTPKAAPNHHPIRPQEFDPHNASSWFAVLDAAFRIYNTDAPTQFFTALSALPASTVARLPPAQCAHQTPQSAKPGRFSDRRASPASALADRPVY